MPQVPRSWQEWSKFWGQLKHDMGYVVAQFEVNVRNDCACEWTAVRQAVAPDSGVQDVVASSVFGKIAGAGAQDAEASAVINKIADTNFWASKESISGTGSTMKGTIGVRQCLARWIAKYNIRTFVDVPCGDGNWVGSIPGLDNILYQGFDIAEKSVMTARSKNTAHPNMSFNVFDISSNVPPKADMIMSRDVIQHWPLSFALKVLQNEKASGSKYLAVTTFPGRTNKEVPLGGFYQNNMRVHPFNFPLELESCQNRADRSGDSDLVLYDLQAWNGL